MTVPAEAIAAAAAVLHDDYCDDGDTRTCGRWNSKVPGGYDPRKHVGFYEDRAREVLEAALPFLAEDGWDAARDRATEANEARRDERERAITLFDEWIDIIMSEPNSHPPEAWKVAFAALIDPDFPGSLAEEGITDAPRP